MSLPELEPLGPIRTAIVAQSSITDLLGLYASNPSVHTVRPVPPSAQFPMIIAGPVLGRDGLQDGINDHRPVLSVDVSSYGENESHYTIVESIAEKVFGLFHRQRNLTIANYDIVEIRCSGPFPAPVDDENQIGRRVALSISLRTKFTD